MEKYKQRFKEANYNLIAKIKDDKTINFYRATGFGKSYQSNLLYWIRFSKSVFVNPGVKFSKINKTPCKFYEPDQTVDAIATYSGTHLIVEFTVDGNTISRMFKIERELDAEVTI
jgi:hypothetical protein